MSRVLVERSVLRRMKAILERLVGPRRRFDADVSLLLDALDVLLRRRDR